MEQKKTSAHIVLFGFRHPRTQHWVKQGDTVELTPREARDLMLGSVKKVEPAKPTTKAVKDK
ncbi:hypothetical protein M9194_19780 [Vibrio sp. S4M6]|uniref:hypothetical protein n=1 Tax=Vibrio sinus TaxID=2946865 RepID=UPI002029BC82|nr:hypothetical protein [Vibrio sinus]MCL9783669.1 hypothetical protein [Vibrio sinus]